MKKIICLFLTLFIFTACSSNNKENKEAADVVYTNALFYTEDENNPEVSVMAVKDGKIVYVGDDSSLYAGENTEVIDLNGAFVTPNILDGHSHPGIVCTTAWYVDMPSECDTKEEILDFVKEYCESHPVEEYPYIYFEYYPSNLFDENGPRKEWIDEVVSDRAILIEDFSDHACWVNSKFLELLGIYEDGVLNAEDEDFFIKDENGDYTGWIKEFVWQNYISNLYEATGYYPPEEVTEETISPVLDDFKSWGVTGVLDAYVINEEHVKTISDLDKEGKLNMYYELAVVMDDPSNLEECLENIHYLNQTYGTDHVAIDTLKIFYDGTNELGDAALIDGWITDESQTGYIMMDTEQTKEVIRRCNEEGVDVHFHMVGDLAFRQVCDATEELINEIGELSIQVEVCHCEYVDPSDYNRPAQLGIIVNWTPHWSGGYFGDGAKQYLGEERYNRMYQFNPMIESGAIVTFGSDIYSMYEEERGNPYFGMQIAMTRTDIWEGIYDGERESEDAKLSLEDLLKGYTINAAIQMRIDDKTGSLTVGKYANFNVYNQNLFEVEENEFSEVLPTAVFFEGKLINGSLN